MMLFQLQGNLISLYFYSSNGALHCISAFIPRGIYICTREINIGRKKQGIFRLFSLKIRVSVILFVSHGSCVIKGLSQLSFIFCQKNISCSRRKLNVDFRNARNQLTGNLILSLLSFPRHASLKIIYRKDVGAILVSLTNSSANAGISTVQNSNIGIIF